MKYEIPFNKPFVIGKELVYIEQAVKTGQIASDGIFTKKCTDFFKNKYQFNCVLMTPSCTASLEMAGMLCDIQPGDEVIMPSYTFVSTANAFVRMGAVPVFVDIREDTLNINESKIEAVITPKTKAIVPVHYAGIGCEMDTIMDLAGSHHLKVIEDAAQGVNATYRGKPLGGIGDFGCFSFHETKNANCGEGGALAVNDSEMVNRAEIIRDKGTNRQQFFRGEIDKYSWVDVGSSYVLSEICSAFLYAQLEYIEKIDVRRKDIYTRYYNGLKKHEDAGYLRLPVIPDYCGSCYHMFYVLLPDQSHRNGLIRYLKNKGVFAVFHYLSLHLSPFGKKFGAKEGDLPVTESVSERLLRLPFFYDLSHEDQDYVMRAIDDYIRNEM